MSDVVRDYLFVHMGLRPGNTYPEYSVRRTRGCRDAQALAGLIIRVPPRIASASRPGAMASQLPAAAKAPAAAQLLDDSASAKVAMREEI